MTDSGHYRNEAPVDVSMTGSHAVTHQRRRATGRARVPASPPESVIRARYAVWRLLDQARLAALGALTSTRRRHPERDDDRVLIDLERFARALVVVLLRHDPGATSRFCPVCSTDDRPCPWPCPLWQGILQELHTPPDIPERATERRGSRPSWFGDPS